MPPSKLILGGHLLVKMGVIQWEHLLLKKKKKKSFRESILFLKMGSLNERTFSKWGSLGESKM